MPIVSLLEPSGERRKKSMSRCALGHEPPGDAAFVHEWKTRIRVDGLETPCAQCAGVWPVSQTRTAPVSLQAGSLFGAQRSLRFCNAARQADSRTGGAEGRTGLGFPRSIVVGVLRRGPAIVGDDVELQADERAAADLFFHRGQHLMRDLERSRADRLGIELPFYPTRRQIMTALAGVHARCGLEFGTHFAFPPGVAIAHQGDSVFTGVLTPQMPYARTLLDGPEDLFLKLAPVYELTDGQAATFARVAAIAEELAAHPEQSMQTVERNERAFDDAESLVPGPLEMRLAFDVAALLVWRIIDMLAHADLNLFVRLRFRTYFKNFGISMDDDPVRKTRPLFEEPAYSFDRVDMDDHRGVFADTLNTESINEIGAALRVTALVRSGICAGFTPMIDYFFCNLEDVIPGGAETTLGVGPEMLGIFMLHATNPAPLSDLFFVQPNFTRLERLDEFMVDYLDTLRSVIAQVFIALEAGQHHIGFVHYDLHDGNVMMLPVHAEERMDTYFQFRRPDDAGDIFIPIVSTNRHLVRIIDFGRSRVASPLDPTDLTHAQIGRYSALRFDRGIDMRMFAYNLVDTAIYQRGWLDALMDDRGRVGASLSYRRRRQFLDLLDVVVDMHNWTKLEEHRAQPFWATPPSGMAAAERDMYRRASPRGYRPPQRFRDFLTLVRLAKPDAVEMRNFRDKEIGATRLDWTEDRQPTPAEVLNMPFFDAYRQFPTGRSMVDFIADGSRQIHGVQG